MTISEIPFAKSPYIVYNEFKGSYIHALCKEIASHEAEYGILQRRDQNEIFARRDL